MKKIVIATDNFLPRWDGIARFLTEVVPQLSKEFEITILAPMFDNNQVGFPNTTVVRFPVFKFQIGDFPPAKPPFRKIKKYIKEADIVWIQSIGPIGSLAAMNAHKYKKNLVSYVHSIEWELVPNSVTENKFMRFLLGKFIKFFSRYIYNKCDMLMVPSKLIAEKFIENKITSPKAIIKLGTNMKKFVPPLSRDEAKKNININPKNKVISFVGRIGREKDLTTLYRAFVQLKKRMQDVVLLIVGTGVKEVMDLFEKRKDVFVVGSKDDVVPYLQATDVYVLPSLTETTSLSTIEAMACGCNVISTKVGRISEYIQNGVNGFFFPTGNVYVLRMKLQKLLENQELMNTIGEKARQSVLTSFAWENTIKDIEKVFDGFKDSESLVE
tara:strand:- start:436 stop:1587 length:1152 start_codon:yes stop_codon:yes gene_type:complete